MSSSQRGQTTIDFAVGVSIFLLTVAAVFLFIPGTIGLFTEGGQADIVTSNRVAATLSEGALVDPAVPHVLNATCTVAFFRGNTVSGCGYSGGNLTERVGVNPRQRVNVTIRNHTESGDGAILCWDESDEELAKTDGDCDYAFSAGERVPERYGTTVSSRRVVEIDGTDGTLLVRMW